MPKCLAILILAVSACASAPERAPMAREDQRAVAPSGNVQIGMGCPSAGTMILWNPSSTRRRCDVEDAGPFEVEGLGLRFLEGVWPSAGISPRCEDAPVDVTARVADELLRLEHEEPSEREEAAKALVRLGGGARSAASALAARVKLEMEAGPLYHAGSALIDLLGTGAVPLLVDGIAARHDVDGRLALAELVVGLGEAAASGLVPRLGEPKVAEAFGSAPVMSVDPEAGRRLMFARLDASGEIDTSALSAYLERRPDDEDVARLALDALRASPDPKKRYRLVGVVSRLRSPAAVSALVGALGDSDQAVVFKAAEALGLLAQASPSLGSAEVADVVAALIPTQDETLLWQATMALGRIGRDTDKVRAALAAASASEDPRIRIIAAAARTQVARERFGVGAMGLIPTEQGASDENVLREGIASHDPQIRGLAMARVEELGSLAGPLVDAVAARLGESGDELWRADSLVEVLLAIGPAAYPALRGVAQGRPRVYLETWLEVVAALGEAEAAPIIEALRAGECAFEDHVYKGVEAAVVRLRLGAARAIDRAYLLNDFSESFSATLVRRLTPHVRSLGLGEMERTVIAWLAEHHIDYRARLAFARMWAELR